MLERWWMAARQCKGPKDAWYEDQSKYRPQLYLMWKEKNLIKNFR